MLQFLYICSIWCPWCSEVSVLRSVCWWCVALLLQCNTPPAHTLLRMCKPETCRAENTLIKTQLHQVGKLIHNSKTFFLAHVLLLQGHLRFG